jgi:hypothetical protein
LGSPSRFTGLLHGGKQKTDESPDYRNDNQDFDQGEAPSHVM